MPSGGAPWLYRLGYNVLRPTALLLRGMEVEGAQNVPRAGRLIVAANHVSWMDPPLVSMAIYGSGRFPRFVAKEELFDVPFLGFFLRGIGCIPLDRGRGDVGAIRRSLTVLQEEGCMVLFPEGTRSRTGLPGRPKAGVGLLARESSAPVLPARVWNTRSGDKGPLRVRFGRPLKFPGGGERGACQEFAEGVMAEILKLTWSEETKI